MGKNEILKLIDMMLGIEKKTVKGKNLFAYYYINLLTLLDCEYEYCYDKISRLKNFHSCSKIELKQIRKIIIQTL